MLNKRLLIQNLLSNNDEGTFYDRKETIDFSTSTGRSKLLKHICALHNSNPDNCSYVLIGVSDDKVLVGSDYYDDTLFQNLVSAYLQPPPTITYENISFPTLRDRSIGLLTIYPGVRTIFSKGIDRITAGTYFHRIGSSSESVVKDLKTYPANANVVEDLIRFSRTTLATILTGTLDFISFWGKEYRPTHIVFKEQFVVCWSGWKGQQHYSEVDIQIINDGVRIFYSANQTVSLENTEDEFIATEFMLLGYGSQFLYVPFECTTIAFSDAGTYSIKKEFLFTPPQFPKEEIERLYKECKVEAEEAFDALYNQEEISTREEISMCFFICYLNGIPEALQDFKDSGDYVDGASAHWYHDCYRILNEMGKNRQ